MRILLFSLPFSSTKDSKTRIFRSFAHFFDNIVTHPGARTWCHALPWWALGCRYPRGPQQSENKIL